MEFYCLGSGSHGNAYIFKDENECILVECGFEYKKLLKKIMLCGILPSSIKAVVCTHFHKDHTESLQNWVDRGVKVVAPNNCYISLTANCYPAQNNSKIQLTENIRILAFAVNHDCDALGYIFFNDKTKEKVLFINDTYYFDFMYNKYDYDYIFIECNHIRGILDKVIQHEEQLGHPTAKYERQAKTHMSLAVLKKFISNLNLKSTKRIYLMHMSEECCDNVLATKVIALNSNKETYYCGRHGGFFLGE